MAVTMTSSIFTDATRQQNQIDLSGEKRQEPELSVFTAIKYFSSATRLRDIAPL